MTVRSKRSWQYFSWLNVVSAVAGETPHGQGFCVVILRVIFRLNTNTSGISKEQAGVHVFVLYKHKNKLNRNIKSLGTSLPISYGNSKYPTQ
jgi:hypothetical protein